MTHNHVDGPNLEDILSSITELLPESLASAAAGIREHVKPEPPIEDLDPGEQQWQDLLGDAGFKSLKESLADPSRGSVVPRRSKERISPDVSAVQSGDDLQILVDLPGVDTADVRLTVEDDILRLEANRPDIDAGTTGEVVLDEAPHGVFGTHFHLPNAPEKDDVSASLRRGVLRITVAGAFRAPTPFPVDVK